MTTFHKRRMAIERKTGHLNSYRRVKNVNGVYSLASSLFVAEHEIDPLVQIVGDIIRL